MDKHFLLGQIHFSSKRKFESVYVTTLIHTSPRKSS
jgi:hypothetical protein